LGMIGMFEASSSLCKRHLLLDEVIEFRDGCGELIAIRVAGEADETVLTCKMPIKLLHLRDIDSCTFDRSELLKQQRQC
jgi:hypothetical protein